MQVKNYNQTEIFVNTEYKTHKFFERPSMFYMIRSCGHWSWTIFHTLKIMVNIINLRTSSRISLTHTLSSITGVNSLKLSSNKFRKVCPQILFY